MRRINLAPAILVFALAIPARAQAPTPKDEGMAAFFGATLEIDVPGQDWSAKRWLKPDHTYREVGTDGEMTGTWAVKDGKLCVRGARHRDDQPPVYCNQGPGKTLGERWSDPDPVTGNLVVFDLKPAAGA